MTSVTVSLLITVISAGGTAVAESGILKLTWGGGESLGPLFSLGYSAQVEGQWFSCRGVTLCGV